MLVNMLLIAIGAAAVLRVLRRFQLRFAFTYEPAAAPMALPQRAEVAQ
jgi:hypothetical protein